ncbi:uncharacterized protein LOC122672253 [Telopea speciosissima]|uniref:uncharacterized protein LOC122672253 n=1 Tax=Telopea speciosissima TaxID=54955 RepID=UPI001CC60FBB|nr:uncharacterized protein LOC122672253 [Telopea speciosissima]
MVECSSDTQIRPFLVDKRCEPAYEESVTVLIADGKVWFTPIVDFIKERRYPKHFTVGEKKRLRKYAMQFMLQGNLLYKRSYDGIQLLCVDEEQAQTIILCVDEEQAQTIMKENPSGNLQIAYE